jgi:hypothetical protein
VFSLVGRNVHSARWRPGANFVTMAWCKVWLGRCEEGLLMATTSLMAEEEAGHMVSARASAAVECTLGRIAFRSGPALGGPICNVGASAPKRASRNCR